MVGQYAKRKENHYLDVQDRIEEIERARGDLVKGEPEAAALDRREKRLAYPFTHVAYERLNSSR